MDDVIGHGNIIEKDRNLNNDGNAKTWNRYNLNSNQ